MLRLSPLAAHERLTKTNALKMGFAGAESNVAVSLAILVSGFLCDRFTA